MCNSIMHNNISNNIKQVLLLEKFYLYSKENTLKDVYKQLNDYYNGEDHELDLESELEKNSNKKQF